MEIKGIGNQFSKLPEQVQKQENAQNTPKEKPADKLEISEEAKKLQSEGVSVKDFSKIKQKINSGFYNSNEVITKVAEEILKDFDTQNI